MPILGVEIFDTSTDAVNFIKCNNLSKMKWKSYDIFKLLRNPHPLPQETKNPYKFTCIAQILLRKEASDFDESPRCSILSKFYNIHNNKNESPISVYSILSKIDNIHNKQKFNRLFYSIMSKFDNINIHNNKNQSPILQHSEQV